MRAPFEDEISHNLDLTGKGIDFIIQQIPMRLQEIENPIHKRFSCKNQESEVLAIFPCD